LRSFSTAAHNRRQPSSRITDCPLPPSRNRDWAAIVAQALLQIATTSRRQCLYQQFEEILRQEFAEERRQAMVDRRLADA
jgi:hypothetical protein